MTISNTLPLKGADSNAGGSEQVPLRVKGNKVTTDSEHVLYKVHETPPLHVTILLALQVQM